MIIAGNDEHTVRSLKQWYNTTLHMIMLTQGFNIVVACKWDLFIH